MNDPQGYDPDIKRVPLVGEPRVIRWHELTLPDKVRLGRALRDNPLFPEAVAVESTERMGNYWCIRGGTLHDFMESAQRAADVTMQTMVVHMHYQQESCEDHDHFFVEPDPVRSKAVGGPEHR